MVSKKSLLSEAKLEAILDDYDSTSIMSMATEWFGKNKKKGKGPAIAALVKVLLDNVQVKKMMLSLGEEEMATLFFAQDQNALDSLSVLTGTLRRGYSEADKALFTLHKKGLILVVNEPNATKVRIQSDLTDSYRSVFLLPTATEFIRSLKPKPLRLPTVNDDLVQKMDSPSVTLFFEKLVKLTRLTKEKKNRVKNDGSPGANCWKLFFKEIGGVKLGEWQSRHMSYPVGEGDVFPIPFVLDMALASGIISPADNLLRPGGLAVKLTNGRLAEVMEEIFHSLGKSGRWADLLIENELKGYAERDSKKKGVYSLTRKSVSSSRLSAAMILKNLSRRSETVLPEDISLAIQGWKEMVHPLESEILRVLAVPEPTVRSGILARESVRKLLIGQLAAGLLVVHPDSYDELLAELKAMGIEIGEHVYKHNLN